MAVEAAQVTVTTTATALTTSEATSGLSVLVKVPGGGATVYVGPATVTASGATQGIPVTAGESLSVDLGQADVLYGIVAASTQVVNVLRTGVG